MQKSTQLHRSGEKLLSIAELAKQIGKHDSSVRRLVHCGCSSLSGAKIYLECIRTESGLRTSLEAYYRFIDDLNNPLIGGIDLE